MSFYETAVAVPMAGDHEEEDEKTFKDYYKNVYGKRKMEWLKSVAESRQRRTREMAETLRPQTK